MACSAPSGQALMLLVFLAAAAVGAQGQGLKISTGQLGSSNRASADVFSRYMAAQARTKSLLAAYKAAPRSSRSSCASSKRGNALCSSLSDADEDSFGLMNSPKVFSWTDMPASGVSSNPFGPVGDQGTCWTCVSFAVAAIGEAAVAKALSLPGGTVRLSVQDLAFCPEEASKPRFCQTMSELSPELGKLISTPLVTDACLPYTAGTARSDDMGTKCQYQCRTLEPHAASGGRFGLRPIQGLVEAQSHIRRWGGVATSLDIYDDFHKFFKSTPGGIYEGADCKEANDAKFNEGHAIVLVGYNNEQSYWVARSSWGSSFGEGGYFKIRYSVCGVAKRGQTFGVVFEPNTPQQKARRDLVPLPGAGCFLYRGQAPDALGTLAEEWGVDAKELFFNNTETLVEPDQPLTGKLLRVCGINLSSQVADAPRPAPARAPVTPWPAPAPAPAPAPQEPTQQGSSSCISHCRSLYPSSWIGGTPCGVNAGRCCCTGRTGACWIGYSWDSC